MPDLVNKATGRTEPVADEDYAEAINSGKYELPAAIPVRRFGIETYATPEQVANERTSTTVLAPSDVAGAHGHELRAESAGGIGGAISAGVGSFLSGSTGGIIDPGAAAEFHPFAAGAGNIASYIAPFLIPGGEAELAAGKLGEATAAEHIAGGLSSKFVHAGEVGAAEGTAGRALESTLGRGKGGKLAGEIAEGATEQAVGSALAPEEQAAISQMTRPELAAARKAEVEAIAAQRTAEAPKLVEGLAEHRAASADDAIFLATKDADAKAIGNVKEAAKLQRDADFSITKMLNNPKALERNPGRILDALTAQENALQQVAKNEPELRTLFAADEGGTRAAALDKLPGALERNRALQERIKAVLGDKTSPRIEAIDAAKDALDAAKGAGMEAGGAKGLAGSAIASHVLGSVFPGVGHVMGAVLGPEIAEKGMELAKHLFRHGAEAVAEGGEGAAGAVKAFMSRAATSPGAAVVGSRVLAQAKFAPGAAGGSMPEAFSRVSEQLRSKTAYNAMGQPQMRPEARAEMAKSIAPLRMVHPLLADKVETVLARKVEFLSSKIPRRPDLPMLGMQQWRPSDMEMRTFARYVDAVENPGDVEKRLAAGTVSPEDCEAYRSVYPERHAQLVSAIVQEMSQSKTPVPFTKRLALWMFAGAPIDASTHPVVLNALQSSFPAEPGTNGGTQAPVPQAAFGSVKKSVSQPTPSQKRQG